MEYLLSFIEGVITFISPCLLPMLPVYISYFAGGTGLTEQNKGKSKYKAVINSLGFVLGFTLVFVLLGAAAGTFGVYIKHHQMLFETVGGLILIIFGLNFMNVIKINFLNRTGRLHIKISTFNFFTSLLFGVIFSIGWTPCIGAFLGSALIMAANSYEAYKGITMLLLFSLGLGIPFVISAVLIDSLKNTIQSIKRHYKIVNIISGLLLVAVGILMMFGRLNTFLALLTIR